MELSHIFKLYHIIYSLFLTLFKQKIKEIQRRNKHLVLCTVSKRMAPTKCPARFWTLGTKWTALIQNGWICDLFGTSYAPVSKIPSVKIESRLMILTFFHDIACGTFSWPQRRATALISCSNQQSKSGNFAVIEI